MIVFYESNEISPIRLEEVLRLNGKTYSKSDVDRWINDNAEQIEHAKQEIDEEIDEFKAEADKVL